MRVTYRIILFFIVLFYVSISIAAHAQTFEMKFPPDAYSNDAWLDLRYLNENKAGDNGFIKLSPDGKNLVNGQGLSQRFWAVNGAGSAKDLTDDQLKSYARYLAKIGVNLIRYHAIISPKGPTSKIDEVDTAEVKHIWRAVAAFKDEGIYTAISPFWAHVSPVPASWELGEYRGDVQLWGLMYVNDRLKAAYKKWVQYLYTTVNPYTGIALKDDAAVALIQIKNEDGLLFYTVDAMLPNARKEIGMRFFAWLEQKYGNIDNAFTAWNNVVLEGDDKVAKQLGLYNIWEATQNQTGGKQSRVSDQVEFYAALQRLFYTEIHDYYRGMGCQQLINANNWKPAGEKMTDAERYSNASVDVMAVNRYYDPQHRGENSGWRIDPGHQYVGASVLYNPHLLPMNVKQIADKPFFITESGWNLPHKYQSEGPFLISSYLSLTGVDAFFWFNASGPGVDPSPYYPWFDLGGGKLAMHRWNASVPGQVSMFPANALLFRKGYVATGNPVVHEERTLSSIWKREVPLILESPSFDPNRDQWGSGSPGQETEVPPIAFLAGPVEVVYNGNPDNSFVAPNLSQLINLSEKTVTSITGQLKWDYINGICVLDAPKAQGAAGFLNKRTSIELSDITIASQNEYAVVQVVSMDDIELSQSEKLLIQIGTIYRPTGWQEKPSKVKIDNVEYDGFEIIDTGKMPWRGIEANITITFKNPKVRSAHMLDYNGYLKREIPFVQTEAGWKLFVPKDAMYVILNSSESNVTGLQETSKEMVLYPNPTNGNFVLKLPENEKSNSIRVIDQLGRIVYEKQNLSPGQNEIILPKLKAGMYQVLVQSSDSKKRRTYQIILKD